MLSTVPQIPYLPKKFSHMGTSERGQITTDRRYGTNSSVLAAPRRYRSFRSDYISNKNTLVCSEYGGLFNRDALELGQRGISASQQQAGVVRIAESIPDQRIESLEINLVGVAG